MDALITLSPLAILLVTVIVLGKGISATEIFLFLYVYFFGGPIFARELGFDIYSGIDTGYIDSAVFIFLISVFAFYFGSLIKFKKNVTCRHYFSINPVFFSKILLLPAFFVIFVGFAWGLKSGALSGQANKVERINVLGLYHYVVVTLTPCFLLVYMGVFRRVRVNNSAFYFLLGLYSVYSFLTDERDFLLFAVPVYFWWIDRVKSSIFYPILMFFMLVSIFVFTSFARSSVLGDGFVSSFLNQGSSLMVLTNVLTYLERNSDFIFGASYFSSLINTFTLGVVKLREPMSAWLSNYYSDGASAYGFSLEAEAYFNFGITGVVLIFFCIGYYCKKIEKDAESGYVFGRILYYHFLFFFIYAIRGESLIIFK